MISFQNLERQEHSDQCDAEEKDLTEWTRPHDQLLRPGWGHRLEWGIHRIRGSAKRTPWCSGAEVGRFLRRYICLFRIDRSLFGGKSDQVESLAVVWKVRKKRRDFSPSVCTFNTLCWMQPVCETIWCLLLEICFPLGMELWRSPEIL